MSFLPDVYVLCEVCGGRRYNQETLAVKYKGFSIADLLEMPASDALPILENIPQVRQKLQTLVDVGLGYIHLGQSAVTLSGGEAQRIKLARELSKRQTGKTLYLLDEPTTGLHFDDVKKLLHVLHRLTDLGNMVVIIEHNLDVIRNADWIIDLGPEGGEDGGRIVAQGTPEQVARNKKSYTGQALAEYFNGKSKKDFDGGIAGLRCWGDVCDIFSAPSAIQASSLRSTRRARRDEQTAVGIASLLRVDSSLCKFKMSRQQS